MNACRSKACGHLLCRNNIYTFENLLPIRYNVPDRRDFFIVLQQHITDEKTGSSYTLCGDYYLPDLSLPEEKAYELGRFGRAKYRHLQKYHKALLTTLRTSGKLSEYLHSIDTACEEIFSRLVKQMAEREGVTEQMKAADMMKWVGRMNNIRNRAEEVIMREYIYEED